MKQFKLFILSSAILCLVAGCNNTPPSTTTEVESDTGSSFELEYPNEFTSTDLCSTYDLAMGFELPQVQDVPGFDGVNITSVYPYLQMRANVLSWEAFISLNWNALPNGQPDTASCMGDIGTTVWEHWMPTYNIYQDPPRPWSNELAANGRPRNSSGEVDRDILGKDGDMDIYNAENLPVVDRYGNFTYFEIFYNKEVYDYVVDAGLNTLKGQQEYVKVWTRMENNLDIVRDSTGDTLGVEESLDRLYFPIGGVKDSTYHYPTNLLTKGYGDNDSSTFNFKEGYGGMVIKVAWRRMTEYDDTSRFHLRRVDLEGEGKVTLGLVAMHLIQKIDEAPQWVWATFEHVDNAPSLGPDGQAIIDENVQYSYFDPSKNDTSLYNKKPSKISENPLQYSSTQIVQEFTINDSTKMANAYYQELIAKSQPNSPWQYYEMIGTQWPGIPSFFSTNMNSTKPQPAKLGNSILETYEQLDSDCMGCHSNARFLYQEGVSYGYFSDFLFTVDIDDEVPDDDAVEE
jgi:hypothetical protein